MSRAIRALLHGAIDYAGLFPPAALDMRTAMTNFAAYLRSDDAWALGRFVVPAARLAEFGMVADEIITVTSPAMPASLAPLLDVTGLGGLVNVAPVLGIAGNGRWSVSAIVGAHVDADTARVYDFNAARGHLAEIDSVEAKATTENEVRSLAEAFPDKAVFVEIPIDRKPDALVDAIAAAGLRAKVRTGGVTADAFPLPGALLDFLVACHTRRVRFKATAGLHHALRSRYRLTYQPVSDEATMFGFLNVLLAAAFLRLGAPERDVLRLLEEDSLSGIRVEEDVIAWRDHALTVDRISETRFDFATSFGSCSFTEPIDELRSLHLI